MVVIVQRQEISTELVQVQKLLRSRLAQHVEPLRLMPLAKREKPLCLIGVGLNTVGSESRLLSKGHSACVYSALLGPLFSKGHSVSAYNRLSGSRLLFTNSNIIGFDNVTGV